MRRTLNGLAPGAMQVLHRLGDVAAETVVMCQFAAVVSQVMPEEDLDGTACALMQRAALFREQRVACDFLGEGVLERILDFRECRPPVDKLCGLQAGQQRIEALLRLPGDLPDQAQGEFLADHGQGLQQFLLREWQPVHARREHALYRGRNMQRGRSLFDTVMAGFTEQRLFLGQSLDDLLQEKGIALGFFEDKMPERREAGVIAQQVAEQALRLGWTEGGEPQCGAIVLVPPRALILGAVVHEQQHPGLRHSLDEVSEEGFGLAVQPLKVLEQQLDGLIKALSHQKTRDGLERALAPEAGTHVRQRRAELADAQQIQQVRHDVFKTALQRDDLARDLLVAAPLVVLSGQLEIIPQEFDERQISKGFAVRHREGLQH
ncbi:hypothetical protein D9M70_153800 [compost metagenome]